MARHVLLFLGTVMVVGVLTLWWAMPAPPPPVVPPPPAVTGPVGELLEETHHAVTETPDAPRRWRQHAESLAANRFFADAAECFRLGLTLDPSDARMWYGLARAESERGESASASAAFERASLLRPDDATPRWRQGLLALERGALDEARRHFDAARTLDPATPAPRYGLARLDILEGDLDAARRRLETMLDPASRYDGYTRHLLSGVLRRLGETEQATAMAMTATDAAVPPWPDAYEQDLSSRRPGYGAQMAVARQHLAEGDPAAAVAILERLEANHATRPMLRVTLGRAYREAGTWRKSVETLETALRFDETLFGAHFELAVTLAALGQRAPGRTAGPLRQRARTHATRAAELNPSYAPAHALVGDLDLLDGALDTALARFERATTLDDDPRWIKRRGITLVRLGRWAEAVQTLSVSIAHDAADADVHRGLALSLANLDRPEEALVALGKARDLGADPVRLQEIETLLGP